VVEGDGDRGFHPGGVAMSTGIDWTERVWNPVTGCDSVSPGCDHCLDPATLVLRADMQWVPIDSLSVGDEVVSFTDEPELGQNRVWEVGTVLAKWDTFKPTVTFTLGTGQTITASEDHKWLVAKRASSKWWRPTLSLTFWTEVRTLTCSPTDITTADYKAGYIAGATVGDGTFRWPADAPGQQVYWRIAKPFRDRVVLDRLSRFLSDFGYDVPVRKFDGGASPFADAPLPMAKVESRRGDVLQLIADFSCERHSPEWMAGWLSGMFDTDASYTGGNLRFCQSKDNGALDRAIRYAKELGFEMRLEEFEGAACPTARLHGGIAENIAFLSAISPVMPHRMTDFYGKRLETPASPVVAISRGPVQRLVDITTSTGTFIAQGALTHNCYAMTMAKRLKGMGQAKYQRDGDPKTSGPGFGLTVHPDVLSAPLRWRKPTRVFVNSMSDLFHADVPDEFIAHVFATMAATPQHTYQVLTKRHGRMRSLLSSHEFDVAVADAWCALGTRSGATDDDHTPPYPLPNVHLGVSAENQQWADIRIPALLETPAAVRWVSAEPLLGPIDLCNCYPCGVTPDGFEGVQEHCNIHGRNGLGWLVIGGESGPNARPCEERWIRGMVEQCIVAGVPVFVKQLGGHPDKRHDIKEFPPGLQVRQYPAVVS